MPFPEKLRLLMRRHGLTQASLGMHVGVSQPAVGKWLAGSATPGADIAKRLAQFLRVPVDALFDDKAELPPDPVEEEIRTRFAAAAEAAGKIPADQPLARQAIYEQRIERGSHRLTMKSLADRLRAMADEIDPPK